MTFLGNQVQPWTESPKMLTSLSPAYRNLHSYLHVGFAAVHLVRAVLALRDGKLDEARENIVLGVAQLVFALP